jgi:hypothetical protein
MYFMRSDAVFNPEEEDSMLLRNFGICLQIHVVLQARSQTLTLRTHLYTKKKSLP